MNFAFLQDIAEYEMFAGACIDAERTFSTSPTMCVLACRKAMELAVKWVYAADRTLKEPWRDNLAALIHEPSFKHAMDGATWSQLRYIWQLGNEAAHTKRRIEAKDAVVALRGLFNFVEWIDYCYGPAWVERKFDVREIPAVKQALTERTIKERLAESAAKDKRIAELEAQVRALQPQFAAAKQEHPADDFNPDEIPEYETRQRYIDIDLKYAGWNLDENVKTEVPVSGMPNEAGQGFVDYVLLGKNGKPLALVEAKRTMYDPLKGEQQARLYADCLEVQYGQRPFIFLSNGFTTYFMDDGNAPRRTCSGVFSQDDLQRLMNRRGRVAKLADVQVNTDIAGGGTNRYYQLEAIRAVCDNMEAGHRKSLLVMATGTGKTRTVAGLVDLLMRANAVTNVLFLADRVALVSQAKHAFQQYLPDATLCNLCTTGGKRESADTRIVFSTYPTILNAVDSVRDEGNQRLFTAAHFDLIVVDEAHRSIFRKYRAIFDYFDAPVVGLTATPKDEVDRNTYDFFEVERGIPTYLYEYRTAVDTDHVLVPYRNIEVDTTFLTDGITYDDLSEGDKDRYEDDWEEAQGTDPADFVPSSDVDKFVFNEQTIDLVLQTLMDEGIRVNDGNRLGKTIIFAQNRKHAALICDRFDKLWPELGSAGFCRRVVHTDDYADTVITDFETKEMPVITVSVDMMDTGIDVPEVVNLVFFKQVKSKVKFWQMIGRGTRLCPGLGVVDRSGAHSDKECFYIFDWCRNFEFFRQEKDGVEGKMPESLSARIFKRQAAIVKDLQDAAFADDEHKDWRKNLVFQMSTQVAALRNPLRAPAKLMLREIDKFAQATNYQCLNDADLADLSRVANLVAPTTDDVYALRFDSLVYAYVLAVMEGGNTDSLRSQIVGKAVRLQKKATVPQVEAKLDYIKQVCSEDYLASPSPLRLEELRQELRDLMKFLKDEGRGKPVVTRITDTVVGRREGDVLYPSEDYEDYKLKVNRYVEHNTDRSVIYKLRHNQPMTSFEFEELGRIFTHELGSETDYQAAYGQTPFGRLVRQIAGLDHEAAMTAFAEFLNDESLTRAQMDFVHKVVDYVEHNGYMELSELNRAPFDQPQKFVRLFDGKHARRLVQLINAVNDNAVKPAV